MGSSQDDGVDINTSGHCFICLIGPEDGTNSMVTGNPRDIKSFRTVLCYLTGTPHPNHFQEEAADKADNFGEGCADGKDRVFPEILKMIGESVPSLCLQCYDKLAEIYERHQQLVEIQRRIQKQTHIVREYVLKTTRRAKGGRQSQRDNFLTSLGEQDDDSSLVLRIHDEIISNVSKPVKFPMYAPLQDKPDSVLNAKTITTGQQSVSSANAVSTSSAALNVLGVPVDPSASYVMVATNVTDPLTGVVTVQPVLLNVSQLQSNIKPISSSTPATSTSQLPPQNVQTKSSKLRQACDICKSRFDNSELKDHLKSHGVAEPLQCKSCPNMYATVEAMINHQLTAGKSGSHDRTCHICTGVAKFLTMNHLRIHYFDVHGHGSKFVCEICSDEFLSKERWEGHQRRFHSSASKRSSSNTGNDRDPEMVKKEGPSKVICSECGKGFSTKDRRLKHGIEQHGHPPLKCGYPGCEVTFGTEKDRKLHVRKDHEGYTIISGDERLPFTCSECGMKFPDRGKLKGHIFVKHSPERPFECDLCDARFKYKRGLQLHVDYVHLKLEKERTFFCDECGKGFFTNLMLKNHKLVHTGERPYGCQHCGQRFRQRVSLATHEKSHVAKGDNFKPKGEMERKV